MRLVVSFLSIIRAHIVSFSVFSTPFAFYVAFPLPKHFVYLMAFKFYISIFERPNVSYETKSYSLVNLIECSII